MLIAAAGVAAGYYMLRPVPPAAVEWQGYAEADFVKVGPTQQGLVTAVHVERGDHVVKGAPLLNVGAGSNVPSPRPNKTTN